MTQSVPPASPAPPAPSGLPQDMLEHFLAALYRTLRRATGTTDAQFRHQCDMARDLFLEHRPATGIEALHAVQIVTAYYAYMDEMSHAVQPDVTPEMAAQSHRSAVAINRGMLTQMRLLERSKEARRLAALAAARQGQAAAPRITLGKPAAAAPAATPAQAAKPAVTAPAVATPPVAAPLAMPLPMPMPMPGLDPDAVRRATREAMLRAGLAPAEKALRAA